MSIDWQVKKLFRLATVGLVLITAVLALSACGTPAEEEGGEEAATVEPIKGTDTNKAHSSRER